MMSAKDGIDLNDSRWEVSSCSDFPALLCQFESLFPQGSIIYIEGSSRKKDVIKYFQGHSSDDLVKVRVGTLWPKPRIYHVPITKESMHDLIALAKKYYPLEIAHHIHVYNGSKVLMQWYDAFSNAPMCFSQDFNEDSIKCFCRNLNLEYEDVLNSIDNNQ